MRRANLQRAAFQSIERAWSARTNSGQRVAALRDQVRSAQDVVRAYRREYEIGQRTLLDLLNAENSVFNARVSLASATGVAVYSDYQLLAATGGLLRHLNIEPVSEARVTPREERSVFPRDIIPLDPGPLNIMPGSAIQRR
jgi:adhesin transport system outer membrane protein